MLASYPESHMDRRYRCGGEIRLRMILQSNMFRRVLLFSPGTKNNAEWALPSTA
jgi:hypothetical protein